MKTVTVKLPEIIREALSVREMPGKSLYARIEDLVFDDPSAPRDLSSHPRHMKGYGRNHSGR